MDTLKSIVTNYYFWLAVEAIIAVVLIVFVSKYARLKKARVAEMSSNKERNRYSQLDEQITNKSK